MLDRLHGITFLTVIPDPCNNTSEHTIKVKMAIDDA